MNKLIASLRIFVSSSWLAYVQLFAWSEPSTYVASVILSPLTYMAFFIYLGLSSKGTNTAEFYIVGNALQMASMTGVLGVTMTIAYERDWGSLIYLIGSPANRLLIFLGRASFNVLNGLVVVAVCFAWGMLLGLDLSHANLPGLAVTILIVSLSTSGLGLLMGSISLMSLSVDFVTNLMFFGLLVFTGANLSVDKMPGWMQSFGAILPLTRGIQSARLLVKGASLGDVLPLLAVELAIGLVYALIGFMVFRWVEFQARRRGTLEAF